ncbi:MAG TPA: hypothetical protein PK876_00825 [Elusimicrobiota bacterium]|nr:hypothetical protein [Elusimicrobiota bacterium]
MKKKVCYCFGIPITQREYHQYGVDVFKARGYEVYCLDLSLLVSEVLMRTYDPPQRYAGKEMTTVSTWDQAAAFLKSRRDSLAIVTFGLNQATEPFYRLLKEEGMEYAQYAADATPLVSFWSRAVSTLRRWDVARWKDAFLYHKKRFLYHAIPPAALDLSSPRYLLAGGRRYPLYGLRPDSKTIIVRAHSMDYDRYLEQRRTGGSQKGRPYGVFLDEYAPYHPEGGAEKEKQLDAQSYYRTLNVFFKYLEDSFGVSMVVAAHPRSRYDLSPDCFEGRRCELGRTVDLVADAEFVATHGSVAVSFAVLYEKPLLFVTSDDFNRSRVGDMIRATAKIFRQKPINMDTAPSTSTVPVLEVHKPSYRSYKEDFIKESGTPDKPFWEIVADAFEAASR